MSAPRFDEIKGDGSTCKLSNQFDERALVYIGLSQAQIDGDSKNSRASSSYP